MDDPAAQLEAEMKKWTKEEVHQWLMTQVKVHLTLADRFLEEDVSGEYMVVFDKSSILDVTKKHGPAVKISTHLELLKRGCAFQSPYPDYVERWSTEQVYQWLTEYTKIDGQHAEKLRAEEVSGDCLVCFKTQDFKDLEVNMGPARMIHVLLGKLRDGPEPILNAVVNTSLSPEDSAKSPNVTKSSQRPSRKKKHAKKASKETIPPPQSTEATRTKTVIWPAPPQPAPPRPAPPQPAPTQQTQRNPALTLLVRTLEDLGKEDLKSFIFHLREFKMSTYESIAQSRLEVKNRQDLADVMLVHYGPDAMLQVTLQILPKIPRRELIADLETKIGQLKQQCAPKEGLRREAIQGEKLKDLLTCGGNSLDYYTAYVVVVNKSNPQQLQYLQFLNKLKLFCVLDFDPTSVDNDGLCHSYVKTRVVNKHKPADFQGEIDAVIKKLNLHKQVSWVFCNGRHDLDSESYRELDYKTWFRTACRDMENVVSFICNPEVILRKRTLIIFLLLSPMLCEKDPIFDAYNAFYKNTEQESIISICESKSTYEKWRSLIEGKCDSDIVWQSIWELSLSEVNGTIMALGPFDQSSGRLLPSPDSSFVVLTQKHEDLMTALDILCLNQCENIHDEHSADFGHFKMKVEENFFRGGKVKWWNFYLCEKPKAKPFIKRDKYEKLKQMILQCLSEHSVDVCTLLNLFHHPGCGGTTLAMHVIWDLRRKFRCAVLKDKTLPPPEVAIQVRQLMMLEKEKPSPVLLLVDDSKDTVNAQNLVNCIKKAIEQGGPSRTVDETPSCQVIILNCVRSQSPRDLYRQHSSQESVYITTSLTPKEQHNFAEKHQELKETHPKLDNFYSFMIMKSNFDPAYVRDIVHNNLENFDIQTKKAELFAFISLLNTYVFASQISIPLCEEFLGIQMFNRNADNVLERMNPFSNFLIDPVEELEGYKSLRVLHHDIASACLEELEKTYHLKVSDIIISMLHCDLFFTTTTRIGKGTLKLSIQRMLIERQSKKDRDGERQKFSSLIEKIHDQGNEGRKIIPEIFTKAASRYGDRAAIPQALARYLYLNGCDYVEALKWAENARKIKENPFTVDTIGRVYKSELKSKIPSKKDGPPCNPEDLDANIKLSKNAFKAFERAQELANTVDELSEGQWDEDDSDESKSYNIYSYVGMVEVSFLVFEMLSRLPFFEESDPLRKKYLQSFLKNIIPITSVHKEDNEDNNRCIEVIKDHQVFLCNLKTEVKEIFYFFDCYFTYTKRNNSGEYNYWKISDYFKTYVKLFCDTLEERKNEKDCNPNLNLKMQVEEQRIVLEEMHADTFPGILQHMDKGHDEVEKIVRCYAFLQKHQQFCDQKRKPKEKSNYILSSIILCLLKPKSKYVKSYPDLCSLLNETLQDVGLHYGFADPYYLALLLFWPVSGDSAQEASTKTEIRTYVAAIRNVSRKRHFMLFRKQSAVAHFYLGKGKGLSRLVPKHKLDECFNIHRSALAQLWRNGDIFRKSEITSRLQRVHGLIELGEVTAIYGKLKIPVRPAYIGGTRSGLSTERVSFYIGFAIDGPFAYDIQLEN